MARIPKETVEQIIHAADLLEVVGDYVQLKRQGQNYWACCPFHDEKSPSFAVNPSKGLYKCFGCGKAGGIVQFVMDADGSSYPEALRALAGKYGVALPEEEERTAEELLAQSEKDSQYIVTDWAKAHYVTLLAQSEDGQGIGYAYLKERGLNLTTIQTFELGYSLDQWDNLLQAAEEAGYQLKYLEKTGLLIQRDEERSAAGNRYYDRFRGRVMFPVHNVAGRVVGFGARSLRRDDKAAKYLNSPESDVYHKSDVLYGLFQARKSIRQQELCYLVEGYLDVLSLHQGGIENVVASSGTSLTESQIRLLRRYTDNVTVLYDGDAAGIKASLRGIDLLLEGGLNVRVVLFPDGEDPDSYIRKVGDQQFAAFIETQSQDFIAFKTTLVARDVSGDPVKKAAAIREVLQSIARVPDALKRQVFLQQTALTFNLEEQFVITEYNKLLKPGGPAVARASEPVAQPEPEPVPDVLQQCEHAVLRLLVLYGAQELRESVTVAHYLLSELAGQPLHTPLYAQLWNECQTAFFQGVLPDIRQLAHHENPAIGCLLADFATEQYNLSPNWRIKDIYVPTESNLLQMACESAILRLNKCSVQRERQQCLTKMQDSQVSEDEQMSALLRYNELTKIDNQLAHILGTVVARAA